MTHFVDYFIYLIDLLQEKKFFLDDIVLTADVDAFVMSSGLNFIIFIRGVCTKKLDCFTIAKKNFFTF